jgi:hypothetical protein
VPHGGEHAPEHHDEEPEKQKDLHPAALPGHLLVHEFEGDDGYGAGEKARFTPQLAAQCHGSSQPLLPNAA